MPATLLQINTDSVRDHHIFVVIRFYNQELHTYLFGTLEEYRNSIGKELYIEFSYNEAHNFNLESHIHDYDTGLFPTRYTNTILVSGIIRNITYIDQETCIIDTGFKKGNEIISVEYNHQDNEYPKVGSGIQFTVKELTIYPYRI